MNSGLIGKVEKAHRYAEERQRFEFTGLQVQVHGDNSDHSVTLDEGKWRCNCDYFEHHDECAHTMALEIMLDRMLPHSAHETALAS
jgi:hypothetical protein